MSRSQLGLALMLGLIIVLGLPAFLLPEPAVVKKTRSSSNPNLTSIPNTTLSLSKTTKKDREQIRYRRKVNINTADKDELQTIPGIGPNMADAILKYRKKGNTFYRVTDLDRIEGFGSKTVASMKAHVTVGRAIRKQAPPEKQGGSKININEASRERLMTLDGVGSVTADRIIRYREENDGIRSRRDLDAIPGIGPATIERILPQLEELSGTSSRSVNIKVNVNTAPEDKLTQLPGIGPVTAERIVEYRRQNGDFGSLGDLKNVSGIGDATVEGLRDAARVN